MLPSEIDSGDGRRFSLRETNPADMLDLIEAQPRPRQLGFGMHS